MSNLKRKSSEYSGSYDSRPIGSNVKVKQSKQEKRKARIHLYKVCFKDWMAIVGIIPAWAIGEWPVLFVFFATPMIDALQEWGTSRTITPLLPNLWAKIGQTPYAPLCGNRDSFLHNVDTCKKVLANDFKPEMVDWITKVIEDCFMYEEDDWCCSSNGVLLLLGCIFMDTCWNTNSKQDENSNVY